MQHTDLNQERWSRFSLAEQMANIGSEIERAVKWKDKRNQGYANMANERALELFDLTLSDRKHETSLKEIARARELWLDFFIGSNQYKQTTEQWRKYFLGFNRAARIRSNANLRARPDSNRRSSA